MDVNEAEKDPRSMTTPELVAWVVTQHHEVLRDALPLLALSSKVARVHGEHDGRLAELERVFADFCEHLDAHLQQEEDALFLQFISMSPDWALAVRELRGAQHDHEALSKALGRMRELSDSYSAPAWACTSYRTLLSKLRALEESVLRHVQVEDQVLFPRLGAA
jgi:regulator of cell morphogenesis and NO signaling